MPRKGTRRGFGAIRQLPSKRWQAKYTGPDLAWHAAPSTFDAKIDAEAWLTDERRLIAAGVWTPLNKRQQMKTAGTITFGQYASGWIARRELKPTTRGHYQAMLDQFLLPRFENTPMVAITPLMVAQWFGDLAKITGPTYRAHAYSLMRTITRTAVDEDVLRVSPCKVAGGGRVKRAHHIEPATIEEIERLTRAMPPRLQLMVLLGAWCQMRFGEIAALRRKDIDLKNNVIKVRRGITRADGGLIEGTPKSEAGNRDIAIPPHLVPVIEAHLAEHAVWGREGLLFHDKDGNVIGNSSMAWHWNKARKEAGLPHMRFHDLRHTGAVLAAATGATLAELMARLGHSTPAAAMKYQHAARGRDAEIAARLSEMVGGSG